MTVRPVQLVVVAAVAAATARGASAQHHHCAPTAVGEKAAPTYPFRASVGASAARFDTLMYAGDYEGLGVGLEWRGARVGVHAGVALYRLSENGATHVGPGDASLAADVTAIARRRWRAGAGLAASLPTGDRQVSLGMGHAMLMPAGWASADLGRVSVTASAGYGRALASLAGHVHGAGPLVEPMNASELFGELRADVTPWRPALHAHARLGAATPVGAAGTSRAFGALGVGWRGARIDTTAELQLGLYGDPFTARGLVETAVHF